MSLEDIIPIAMLGPAVAVIAALFLRGMKANSSGDAQMTASEERRKRLINEARERMEQEKEAREQAKEARKQASLAAKIEARAQRLAAKKIEDAIVEQRSQEIIRENLVGRDEERSN